MRVKLFSRNFFKIMYCILMLIFSISAVSAQRYLGVSLVNENDNPQLDLIQKSKDVGCNAVLLSIQWGSIEGKLSRILKQENGDNYNVWKQYDDQISLAVSLGMKIGINVAVSTGDDVTNSLSDRYGINTGDGWSKEDRILNVNYEGQEAVFQKQGGAIRPNVNLQFVMTSIAAQSTKDRIVDFAKKVVQRYMYLQDSDNLLYVNLIYTRQGEGEFEMGTTKFHFDQQLNMSASLTDYSQPMVLAYINWLTNKYGNISSLNANWGTGFSSFGQISPKRPSGTTFTGPDGTDWFLFRTFMLKETNNLFNSAVKSVDQNIKVISHHGSVYDRISRGRGTLAFNEIAAGLDGIKINDDYHYDHRFAMDLLRTNLPGKIYVNEAAYYDGKLDPFLRQIRESYTHGAQIVSLMFLDRIFSNSSVVSAIKAFTQQWVDGQDVTTPLAANSESFTLSSIISTDGCVTNRDNYSTDCDAYMTWRSAFDDAGSRPVNIFLQNDLIKTGLPVTLVKFAADKQESSIALDWQTSEETNSDHFEIQHSIDGRNWAEIGNVLSSHESKIIQHYTYTHNNPVDSENLYRLKMIDQDGTFAFSRIVSVDFEKRNGTSVYPNPVTTGEIQLKFAGTSPHVSLTDINGTSIRIATERSGSDNLTVKTQSKLLPGLYILTAGEGSNETKHKVVVTQ